ncbi:MAG: SRPBCC family protein [Ilumatobacteraceae bacterium]|nr:SRPBCC family protein [Ilumatobacteraceae bacterium]MBU6241550.1 SRPBCC family protein [Acidobacteriota bacterium]
MGSVRRHAILAASAADVWAFIGRPEALHEWFPTTSTRVEGDKRWVTLPSGIVFEEQIVLVDNDLRRFQYSIIGNPLVTQHLGTIDVIAITEASCIVVYSTNIEPEVLGLAIGAAAGDGLRTLQEKFGKA